MKRYVVRLNRNAATDLVTIRDFVAQARSRSFAKDFAGRILRHCESFRTTPHRGTLLDNVRPGVRTVPWRKTVTIAFRVVEDTREVIILAILYRGRDVLAELERRGEV